jgi:hypothetical protein
MVPGTVYSVTYKGGDGRTITAVAQHAATIGTAVAGQVRFTGKNGTFTIDQSMVTAAATSAAAVGDPT